VSCRGLSPFSILCDLVAMPMARTGSKLSSPPALDLGQDFFAEQAHARFDVLERASRQSLEQTFHSKSPELAPAVARACPEFAAECRTPAWLA